MRGIVRNHFVFFLFAITSQLFGSVAARAHVEEELGNPLELANEISSFDPFVGNVPSKVDPIYHQSYDSVLLGPSLKAPSGLSFDYYRYVTYYNITERTERIHELPIHRQECGDQAEIFATYTYSYTFSSQINASVTIEGLGLSSTMTAAKTISTTRNLSAEGHVIAEHTPYFIKQDWSGLTFMQTYQKKSKRIKFITQVRDESSPWIQFFLPAFSHSAYPMNFEVKNADWIFDVEKRVLQKCPPSPFYFLN